MGYLAINIGVQLKDSCSRVFGSSTVKSLKKKVKRMLTRTGKRSRNVIAWYEFAAVLWAITVLGESLKKQTVFFFIDNEVVRIIRMKNYSRHAGLAVGCQIFWNHCARLQIDPIFLRVASKLNPADEPSRNFSNFPLMEALGAIKVETKKKGKRLINKWLRKANKLNIHQ